MSKEGDRVVYNAFTREELTFIQNVRRSTIRVAHDGRLEISFSVSEEFAAKQLHDLRAEKGADDGLAA